MTMSPLRRGRPRRRPNHPSLVLLPRRRPSALRALLRWHLPRGPVIVVAATYYDAITVSPETVAGNLGTVGGTETAQELMEAARQAREGPPTWAPSDGLTLGGCTSTVITSNLPLCTFACLGSF